MITRAKALLIIVGDHEHLKGVPDWEKFIEYLEKEGALLTK